MNGLNKACRLSQFYIDPCCPRSWLFYKNHEHLFTDESFIPVSNFKIAALRRFTGHRKNIQVPSTDFNDILLMHVSGVPQNYKEIYKTYLSHRSVLSIYLLIAIKEHFPERLIRSYQVLGERIWTKQLPIHKGCYLSTCAREAGFELRESEFLISRLTHRLYRSKLEETSMDCVAFSNSLAPFVNIIKDDGNSVVLEDSDSEKIKEIFIDK